MGEAILPGNASGESSSAWELIGEYTNSSTSLSVSGPSSSTLTKYTMILVGIYITQIITPRGTDLQLYVYGQRMTRFSGNSTVNVGKLASNQIMRHPLFATVCPYDQYVWLSNEFNSSSIAGISKYNIGTSNAVEIRERANNESSYAGSANTLNVSIYGIKDPLFS